MANTLLVLALLVAKLGLVAAHGGVVSYTILGKEYPGFRAYNPPTGQITIQRRWDTYDPIQNVSAPTLACNNAGAALPAGQQLTATGIPAGTNITAKWNKEWQHNTGPVLTYLGSCGTGTCDAVDSSKVKWFKIQESGLLSGTVFKGQWAAAQMMANNMSWTTKIPSTIASGHYLLRFETIALHSTPSQFYPECAQIEIVNNSTSFVEPTAAELVTFPGGYKLTDPGINVDLYNEVAKTATKYVIPGPPIYGGAVSK